MKKLSLAIVAFLAGIGIALAGLLRRKKKPRPVDPTDRLKEQQNAARNRIKEEAERRRAELGVDDSPSDRNLRDELLRRIRRDRDSDGGGS